MSLADHDGSYPCEHVVPIEREPRHHLVIENEFVRGFAVEIAPHDLTLCHHHPNDYVLYVAGDAEIVSMARDEESKQLSYRDGECELLSAGMVHVVENLSDTPFRNIVAELLPRTGALRRGADPKLIRGEAKISPHFDHDRAAVFVIELASTAEVEVRGPALVATPYGSCLNPEDPGDITVKANPVSDLAWVPKGARAILWGSAPAARRVVVFKIGQRGDEQLAMVRKLSDPLNSLRAHADEPE